VMSALGQKQTCAVQKWMSVLGQKLFFGGMGKSIFKAFEKRNSRLSTTQILPLRPIGSLNRSTV